MIPTAPIQGSYAYDATESNSQFNIEWGSLAEFEGWQSAFAARYNVKWETVKHVQLPRAVPEGGVTTEASTARRRGKGKRVRGKNVDPRKDGEPLLWPKRIVGIVDGVGGPTGRKRQGQANDVCGRNFIDDRVKMSDDPMKRKIEVWVKAYPGRAEVRGTYTWDVVGEKKEESVAGKSGEKDTQQIREGGECAGCLEAKPVSAKPDSPQQERAAITGGDGEPLRENVTTPAEQEHILRIAEFWGLPRDLARTDEFDLAGSQAPTPGRALEHSPTPNEHQQTMWVNNREIIPTSPSELCSNSVSSEQQRIADEINHEWFMDQVLVPGKADAWPLSAREDKLQLVGDGCVEKEECVDKDNWGAFEQHASLLSGPRRREDYRGTEDFQVDEMAEALSGSSMYDDYEHTSNAASTRGRLLEEQEATDVECEEYTRAPTPADALKLPDRVIADRALRCLAVMKVSNLPAK